MKLADSKRTPGLSQEARDELINAAIQHLVSAAKELGVSICELHCMFKLGMTPVDVVDYLDAKLNKRIQ